MNTKKLKPGTREETQAWLRQFDNVTEAATAFADLYVLEGDPHNQRLRLAATFELAAVNWPLSRNPTPPQPVVNKSEWFCKNCGHYGMEVICPDCGGSHWSRNTAQPVTEGKEEDCAMEFSTGEGCTCGKYAFVKSMPAINACPIHQKNLYKKQVAENSFSHNAFKKFEYRPSPTPTGDWEAEADILKELRILATLVYSEHYPEGGFSVAQNVSIRTTMVEAMHRAYIKGRQTTDREVAAKAWKKCLISVEGNIGVTYDKHDHASPELNYNKIDADRETFLSSLNEQPVSR